MDPVEIALAIVGGVVLAALFCWLAVLIAVRVADRRRRQ
jgi:hypothetical protein